MAKINKKSSNIPDANFVPDEAYVTWSDDIDSKREALKTASASLDEFATIQRTTAYDRYRADFSNIISNTSGRPGLTREDYDYFRPHEAVSKHTKAIIRQADKIYQRVGLVKNVIDLMGDFAVQGIRLSHKNKRIERFYKQWFKKIKGKDRSERFLNNLYRTGNIVIHKQTAKLSLKAVDKMYKATGEADIQINDIDDIQVDKREIPWKYTFIDPTCVDVSAGALSSFVNNKTYELLIPPSLRKMINAPKTEAEKKIIDKLPFAIIAASKDKKPYPLDPEKTIVYHYKKDDWQTWAYPMIYAIMDDINVIEKLKLADMSALDGAISNIRIFKLGNLEHKIAPTKAATAKLAGILQNNVGGGTMDLVWGPDIELLESKTNVHQFLGEGKYVPHLNAVYAGLGIPPTLTGTFGASGTTNNFISLKTLTQRLQYGRDILIDFWDKEIELVQKAMGFRYPAKIEFDRMDLSNEDTEKALLIQLADRNLISDELIQHKFGLDPDIEKHRLNRESKERTSDRMVRKAGPWYDPQIENSLKKIALQGGTAAPSQVGLELGKKKSGEKTSLEMRQPAQPNPTKLAKDSPESLPKRPGEGRPKTAKDSKKRKQKTFKPRTAASLILWANDAQDKISEILNPILLDFFNKKNLRSLSNLENVELDQIKTKILFGLDPFEVITESKVLSLLQDINNTSYNPILKNYANYTKDIKNELNKELSVEDYRHTKSCFYSSVYIDYNGENT
jgi:hypothetical protein